MSDKMTQEELDKIIELHEQWLEDESTGERAVFTGKEICGLSFKDCCLSEAWFTSAVLTKCKFSNVDLSKCSFVEASLYNVTVYNTKFNECYFKHVSIYDSHINNGNFEHCAMQTVNMEHTFLCISIFDNINFVKSSLHDVQITGCSFKDACFTNTMFFNSSICITNFDHILQFNHSYFIDSYLYEVTFDYYRYSHSIFLNCRMHGTTITNKAIEASVAIVPETGSFIGYKKALIDDDEALLDGVNEVLVTLKITEDSKRLNANGRKCRCSKAEVLSIVDEDGKSYYEAYSGYNDNFVYKVGEIVEVEDFDDDKWRECATGIHFFLTKDEALVYKFN